MKQKKKSFRRKGKNNKKNKSKRNKRKNNRAIILYQKGGDGDILQALGLIAQGLWWFATKAGPAIVEGVKKFGPYVIEAGKEFFSVAEPAVRIVGNEALEIANKVGNVALETASKVGNVAVPAANKVGNVALETASKVGNVAGPALRTLPNIGKVPYTNQPYMEPHTVHRAPAYVSRETKDKMIRLIMSDSSLTVEQKISLIDEVKKNEFKQISELEIEIEEIKNQKGGDVTLQEAVKFYKQLKSLQEGISLNKMKEMLGDEVYSFFCLMYGIPEKIDENKIVQLPAKYKEFFDSFINVVENSASQKISQTLDKKSLVATIENLKNSRDNSSFFTNYFKIMIEISKLKKDGKKVGDLLTKTNIAYMNFIRRKFPNIVTKIQEPDFNTLTSETSPKKIAQIFLIDLIKKSELNLSKIRQFFMNCKLSTHVKYNKQNCRSTTLQTKLNSKLRDKPVNFQVLKGNDDQKNKDDEILTEMIKITEVTYPGVIEGVHSMEIPEGETKSKGGKKSRKHRKNHKGRKGRKQRKTRRHRRRKH